MSLTTASLFVLFGLIALLVGADWLVRGAARIASHFGVSRLAIGLTVVAYGTSAPEIVASLVAAVEGHTEVTIGNVVGSNIANIGLILGLAAILTPLATASSVLKRELPFMIAVTLLVHGLAFRLVFDRAVGILFLLLLVTGNLVTFLWARSRDGSDSEENQRWSLGSNLAVTAAGLALLLGGAHCLVDGAVTMARALGLSELVVGITLVALGTSLPELATSIVAGLRGESDLIVGNVVGSNIFNLLGALGVSAILRPIEIRRELVGFEFLAMTIFTTLMAVFLLTGRRLTRLEGAVLLVGYCGFIAAIFL